jgi:hypothetical protein
MARPVALIIAVAWYFFLPSSLGVAKDNNGLNSAARVILAQTDNQQPAQPQPDTSQPGTETQPDAQAPAPDSGAGTDESTPDDSGNATSLGEIPAVETVDLTPDLAKRALDAYIMVREKYKDANLEEYENLQDFVDETDLGKKFEADIKSYGFANVNEWNTAVTSVGVAYSGIVDDQSGDIRQQIEDVKKDNSIAQDMKDRMIASLNAMIPSDNNKKVVAEMMKDPGTVERLKLLGEEQADE